MHCQSCDFPSQNTNKRFLYQDKELISSYLKSDWTLFVTELDSALASLKFFSHKYGRQCVDYAIPAEFTALDNNNNDLYRATILSGERMFLYDMFYRIYSNSCTQGEQILFYAYLLAKNRLRRELVQINDKEGFANFQEYESRKEIFISEKSVYDTLISNLAVKDVIKRKNSYIEARITPKETSIKLQESIIKLDENICNSKFIAPAQRKERNVFSRKRIHPTKWHYVLHFIKRPDKTDEKKLELGIYCRNYDLRQEIMKQAKAIARFRKRCMQNASRIVGIDAANSEIGCRPEVFAQIFRYLRNAANHIHSNELAYLKDVPHHNLGRTYHVGEDYYDIVDGLRAIEEAVLFLNLSEGDRIGHAVALGINARNYYKDNRTLEMPTQIILDDVAWLYNKIRFYGLKTDILYDLQQQFEYYFRKIFIQKNSYIKDMPTIYTYYQSWLLRGNDPNKIDLKGTYNATTDDLLLGYPKFFRNRFSDEIMQAWENKEAQELFYVYHFDATVRKEGDKSDQFKIKDKYVEIVEDVQERMRCDMEKRHISIETNPTSNYCISTMKRYDEHPILMFNNDGLILPEGYKRHSIPVTINTDDAGVFDTNLRREFSLMALAIEKNNEVHNSPQQIYDWIDRVRNMAYVQKFDKNEEK